MPLLILVRGDVDVDFVPDFDRLDVFACKFVLALRNDSFGFRADVHQDHLAIHCRDEPGDGLAFFGHCQLITRCGEELFHGSRLVLSCRYLLDLLVCRFFGCRFFCHIVYIYPHEPEL